MSEDVLLKEAPWPSIAIVAPSSNQSQFLSACIASVLDQGYAGL
jgi:hypothetical protein